MNKREVKKNIQYAVHKREKYKTLNEIEAT